MKKLSFFLIGACMAMVSAVAVADGTLFYEQPVYTVISYDSIDIDEHSGAIIARGMKISDTNAGSESDKDQMIYAQVNCDRCHTDKAKPNKGFVTFSISEKQPTTAIIGKRYRF